MQLIRPLRRDRFTGRKLSHLETTIRLLCIAVTFLGLAAVTFGSSWITANYLSEHISRPAQEYFPLVVVFTALGVILVTLSATYDNRYSVLGTQIFMTIVMGVAYIAFAGLLIFLATAIASKDSTITWSAMIAMTLGITYGSIVSFTLRTNDVLTWKS